MSKYGIGSLKQQIKEMRKLLMVTSCPEDKRKVMEAIMNTQTELIGVYTKQSCEPSDFNGLPEWNECKVSKPESTLNPDGKSRACSCGARHTSNPNYHMRYCDLHEWK